MQFIPCNLVDVHSDPLLPQPHAFEYSVSVFVDFHFLLIEFKEIKENLDLS